MKATITHAEWQHVAELLLDGQQLLVGVEDIERRIALTLGREPGTDPDADVITDAVAGVVTLDYLLRRFDITVEETPA